MIEKIQQLLAEVAAQSVSNADAAEAFRIQYL